MNRGDDGVSPSARRISAMRFARFFSTTNVSGHRRSCSALLGEGLGPRLDEQEQELERLRRQGHGLAGASELAGSGIDDDIAKVDPHDLHSTPEPEACRTFRRQAIELLVATGVYLVVLIPVVYLTRESRRRVVGALAGGLAAAVVALFATTMAELMTGGAPRS